MDIQQLWDKALKDTEIVRTRALDLPTYEATALPYIFLAESGLNAGDTVVRKGQVVIERPALILPTAQFQGFEVDQDMQISDDAVLNFLLVRGIRFPSLRYRHEHSSLDLREGSLKDAITHFTDTLRHSENIATGLVIGPEEAWQFSILILVGSLIARSSEGDLRRLLEDWKRRQRPQ